MSWVAAAVVGSSVVGGVTAHNAASQQADAARRAQDIQQAQYNQTREDLAPYRGAGTMALSELQNRLPELNKPFSLQDFQASPAYQFNLEQGKLALDKASAARGKYYAPSTLQDIAKYSQGVASNEYQNAYSNYNNNMQNIFNRLYSISGSGQNAAAQTGAFGSNAAGQMGQAGIAGANASAAGQVGVANALTSGVGNYLNYQTMQQILAGNQAGSVPYAGSQGPQVNPVFTGEG